MFANFQILAKEDLPADDDVKLAILQPVKPCVTRWNSFCSAFERAVELQPAFNAYINFYVEQQRLADTYARTRNNKTPYAPVWMRSDGLTAADWAVITEYIDVLKPLKDATKRVEGRGKGGRFGAIYEVIPVFEYLMETFEARVRQYERVNFNQHDGPEDHLAINFSAAWDKLSEYYGKLDESPAYFAACALHPYDRRYCEKAWKDKPEWLAASFVGFRQVWADYQAPQQGPPKPCKERGSGAMDDAISSIIDDSDDDDEFTDEYERWVKHEPAWSSKQFKSPNVDGDPIKYWVQLQTKYPNLSRFAIDILSIPASSCECERMFSELGDLLAPRRRKIGSQLLAAPQCIRAWIAAGIRLPASTTSQLSDSDLNLIYSLSLWDKPNDSGKYSPLPASITAYCQAWLTTSQSRRPARHLGPISRII
jgi:hypothetical protein